MKRIAIIGYGKSGRSAERLLYDAGFEDFTYFDDGKIEGAEVRPLSQYKETEFDFTLVSPGIPPEKLKSYPENVLNEIDLAWERLEDGNKVIGITGTNGKSTVTHLTARILNALGVPAVACGNIGYPMGLAVLDNPKDTVFVTELSSFQIELLKKVKLLSASVINLTPDHLNRYGSLENYYDAKLKILDFVDDTGLLAAAPHTLIANRALKAKYRVKYIDEELAAYPRLVGNILNFGEFYADISHFPLFGRHNLINLSFALTLAASATEIKGDVTEIAAKLTGMPHRTEFIGKLKFTSWINDSKATNVDSTLVALRSCPALNTAKGGTVALLGGRDKGGDFTALIAELDRCAWEVVLFGEAGDIIEGQLKGKIKAPIKKYKTLKAACKEAARAAGVKGADTVILTPACASFDEFKNFEERGDKFREYFLELNGKPLTAL